jgi:dynein heavy chain
MGSTMNEVMEKLPTSMIVPDSALAKTTDVMPYVQLLQQEVVALNNLLNSVRHSLSEIQQVLQGELQISREIEETMDALVENKVPSAWLRISYPSLRMLGAWVSDLCKRATYLRDWCAEPNLSLPKVTWLPGLFAPKCFMTAVQLFASNRNGWAVDQSIVQAEVRWILTNFMRVVLQRVVPCMT